jgi:hypothetical protein
MPFLSIRLIGKYNYLVRILYVVIFMLSLSTHLLGSSFYVNFGSDKIELKRVESGFLSLGCSDCKAMKLIGKKVILNRRDYYLRNPFSVACKKLNGEVIIGVLYNGNTQSFCQLSDKSILSSNLLRPSSKN